MRPFKFLSGVITPTTRYVPIITKDTHTTYHIPVDLYGYMLQLAVDLHRDNYVLFNPVEYRTENEIGQGVTYFFKIDNVVPYFNIPNRVMIEYCIKFPDTEYYSDFITQENVSLHETI